MRGDLAAGVPERCDQFRTHLIDARIQEYRQRQFERTAHFKDAPSANPIPVVKPAIVEHIGRRGDRNQLVEHTFAKRIGFEIERDIEAQAFSLRPAEWRRVSDRPIRIAAVLAQGRLDRLLDVHRGSQGAFGETSA